MSEKDLQSVWKAGLETPDAAAVLQKAGGDTDNATDLQKAIELDLYKQTLRQGQVSKDWFRTLCCNKFV